MNLKAIETYYNGYRFRSKIEARWAVFLDGASIDYEYEKEGYDLGEDGLYLPDFFLPSVGVRKRGSCWLEIKGEGDVHSCDKLQALCETSEADGILAVGPPCSGRARANEGYFQHGGYWDNFMTLLMCNDCGHPWFDFGGEEQNCPKCGCNGSDEHPLLLMAYNAAKQARFEHGQSPCGGA